MMNTIRMGGVCGLALASSAGVFATSELHVPNDFALIQDAIDAAAPFAVIVVSPGTYNETLNLRGKALTLRSVDPVNPQVVQATVIDATGLDGSVLLANSGETASTVVEGLTITGGNGTMHGGYRRGGGLYARFSSPTIRHCRFIQNSAPAGGAVALEFSSSMFEACHFEENVATSMSSYHGGGAVNVRTGSMPVFTHCTFARNTTTNGAMGGGAAVWGSSIPDFVNCLFDENSARHGAGIYINGASAHLINCTAVRHHASATGAFLYVIQSWSEFTAVNSIFWENKADQGDEEFLVYSGAPISLVHCMVQSHSNMAGPGVLVYDDPGFIDSAAGKFGLRTDSPAIDKGLDAALPSDLSLDLAGATRIMHDAVDIGAFEVQDIIDDEQPNDCAIADVNGDGAIDASDLLILLASWGACAGCPADLTGTGFVGGDDLLLMLQWWGSCP